MTMVGPGSIVMNIRGGNRPVVVTDYDVFFPRVWPGEKRPRAGVSVPKAGLNVRVEPREDQLLRIPIDSGYVISTTGSPPVRHSVFLTIRMPEESLPPKRIDLYLSGDNTRYYVGLPHEWLMDTHLSALGGQRGIVRRTLGALRMRTKR
jgi:hypothetical protein